MLAMLRLSGWFLRRSRRLMVRSVVATLVCLPVRVAAQASPPGGFVELATSTAVRPVPTPTQIQDFVQSTRGVFTFPAPYNTQGIRVTAPGDCAGHDCVWPVGYSYWRNMNNHVGSDTMYIFLGLDKAKGGDGPTLFSYNKTTDATTKVGPLFAASSAYSEATGEGWYFSATQPTTLYINLPVTGSVKRYDVLSHVMSTVFDVGAHPDIFGTGNFITQFHSSNDDNVHSATLRDGTTYDCLGCLAYRESTNQFYYYPQLGFGFDECQIDKSGRYLLIKEKIDADPLTDVDNRIIDLTVSPAGTVSWIDALSSGAEVDLPDQSGAGGHSDNGYGTMVVADNWNTLPNAIRLWRVSPPTLGSVVYRDPQWLPQSVQHLSFANARSYRPAERQYVCGSGASADNGPRANEVVCFTLDGSLRTLVVAPVMTDMNASGGGDSYSKLPKGNVDVTGRYFIWTTNLGGSRLDAFIAKVPAQLLPDAPFTDDVLTAGVTPIRAVHIRELRERIDSLRAQFGLAAFSWTSPTLTVATTFIRAQQIIDLRTALAQAYVAAGRTPPEYTDPDLTAGGTFMKAIHITELRAAVVALET
jgi:hypothetical protein